MKVNEQIQKALRKVAAGVRIRGNVGVRMGGIRKRKQTMLGADQASRGPPRSRWNKPKGNYQKVGFGPELTVKDGKVVRG